MFESGLKESIENKMEITDFSIETVELALSFVYDREFRILTLTQKLDVLKFFDKYAITDLQVSFSAVKVLFNDNVLKDSMETSLAEDISFETIVQITNSAIQINLINLLKRCKDFLVACHRMNRSVEDLKFLDKDFALQVLKTTFNKCDTA